MIVSNTSPLRYLIAVEQADLIHSVFGEVLIPPAVVYELTHPSGRDDVRHWMMRPPDWLKTRELKSRPAVALSNLLDPGECEAIQLALETQPDFVLIDERLGRKPAQSLGLTLIGALGLLLEAYRQNYIERSLLVLDQMRKIGFRVSATLGRRFKGDIEAIRRT